MSPTSLADLVNALRHDVIQVSVTGDPAQAVHDVELLDCESGEGAGGFGHLLLGVGLDVGSPAATNTVVSKLQSDPSINFAYFTIGDLAVGIEPALKQAGIDVHGLLAEEH